MPHAIRCRWTFPIQEEENLKGSSIVFKIVDHRVHIRMDSANRGSSLVGRRNRAGNARLKQDRVSQERLPTEGGGAGIRLSPFTGGCPLVRRRTRIDTDRAPRARSHLPRTRLGQEWDSVVLFHQSPPALRWVTALTCISEKERGFRPGLRNETGPSQSRISCSTAWPSAHRERAFPRGEGERARP